MIPPADGSDGLSQWERMLTGQLYRASDPEVASAHRRARLLLERFNATTFDQADLRRNVLGELLGHFGSTSEIRPPFYCDYGTQVSMGAGSFANFGLVALDPAPIVIGDDVQIGPNVQLLTPTHPVDPEQRRAGWEAAAPSHHRRQRVAGRRCDRAARRDHRGRHGGGRRLGGDP